MCICAIAWKLFDDKPLVILANRDEFFARPTLPLHLWENAPILAGQDLTAGGTWFGLNPSNQKWAIILNFREILKDRPNFSTSRGKIISEFLTNGLSPLQFAKGLNLQAYDGFNLVVGDSNQAVILNNKGFPMTPLTSGLCVLSNGQPEGLDKHENWFKTERLRMKVRQELLPLIETGQDFLSASFTVLGDITQAPLQRLPITGLPHEAELALSSIFIPPNRLDNLFGQQYGTRCSSILVIKNKGYEFYEKTFTAEEEFLTQFSQ